MDKKTIIPKWHPNHPPIYDISKSYMENAEFGPFFSGLLFQRPPIKTHIDFFGFRLNSPVGVPVGPLLNSNWVFLASKLGFDILTYNTVRATSFYGHPLPNVSFVDRKNEDNFVLREMANNDLKHLTIAHSFGFPCRSPDFVMQDIERAQKSLAAGQILIVSAMFDEACQAAYLAKSAGAKIIEVDLSQQEGSEMQRITKRLVETIKPIPLIIKIGKGLHSGQLREILVAISQGGASGICGLSPIATSIVNAKNKSETAYLSGAGIQKEALQFVKTVKEILHKEKLDLTLLGCGGIMEPSDIDLFLQAGAAAALSATGMTWDPYLAMRYHQQKAFHAS